MGTYKVPAQNLSYETPDEGVVYQRENAPGLAFYRQGNKLFQTKDTTGQYKNAQTKKFDEGALGNFGFGFNNWQDVSNEQFASGLSGMTPSNPNEIFTQGVSSLNPNARTITSNISGTIEGEKPMTALAQQAKAMGQQMTPATAPIGGTMVGQTAPTIGGIQSGLGGTTVGKGQPQSQTQAILGQLGFNPEHKLLSSTPGKTGTTGGFSLPTNTSFYNPNQGTQQSGAPNANQANALNNTQQINNAGGVNQGGIGNVDNSSSLEQSVLSAMQPSADTTDLQNQQIALENKMKMLGLGQQGQNNALEDQPIAMPFITGQKAALEKSYALERGVTEAQQQTLQQKLALAQSKQQSALDMSKFQLARADKKTEMEQGAKGDAAKLAEQQRQFNAEMALAEKKYAEDVKQFGQEYALKQYEASTNRIKVNAADATEKASQGNVNTTSLLSNVSLIDEILKNPGAISGAIQFGSIPFTAGATTKNQYTQLKGILALSNRQLLKGSGAVSDYESRTLDKASSDLGRNQSEADFKASLSKVRGVFATAAGLSTNVKIVNPQTGESQVIPSNRAGIDQALKDGMRVEYQ